MRQQALTTSSPASLGSIATTKPASNTAGPCLMPSTTTFTVERVGGKTSEHRSRGPNAPGGASALLAPRARLVLPPARHRGVWRTDRARWLHAARPRRETTLDSAEGLQGRPRACAARPRAACRAARDLPRLARPRCRRRNSRSNRFRSPVLHHGLRALGLLPCLRRPRLDAGRLLRHRRGRHRHHCSKHVQTRKEHPRERSTSLDALPRKRPRDRLDREGACPALHPLRRPRGRRVHGGWVCLLLPLRRRGGFWENAPPPPGVPFSRSAVAISPHR